MGYILLGHGGLDLDPSATPPDMGVVAIPAGTTIQFYADTGQGLVYGSGHLDIWSQLQAPWPALDATNVTYNLTLYSATELWDDELKNDPDFGGHTLLRAGVDGLPDPIMLCSGSPDTCPTDPRQVAAGAVHGCDGILGRYSGDLYWLACTSLSNASNNESGMVLAGSSTDVVMGEDPDWLPEDADFAAIAEVNRANVKAAGDGDDLDYVIGGFVFLIGDGHDSKHEEYARFQEDIAEGTVTVNKGGAFSAGSLEIAGVPVSKQGVVEDAVGRFSDKEIVFT